jgi:hypothetical protein
MFDILPLSLALSPSFSHPHFATHAPRASSTPILIVSRKQTSDEQQPAQR